MIRSSTIHYFLHNIENYKISCFGLIVLGTFYERIDARLQLSIVSEFHGQSTNFLPTFFENLNRYVLSECQIRVEPLHLRNGELEKRKVAKIKPDLAANTSSAK